MYNLVSLQSFARIVMELMEKKRKTTKENMTNKKENG